MSQNTQDLRYDAPWYTVALHDVTAGVMTVNEPQRGTLDMDDTMKSDGATKISKNVSKMDP